MLSLRSLLTSTLPGVTVHSDFVPETELNPAVAYSNVAFNHNRVLEGEKVAKWSVWRVQVVADDTSSVESIIDSLETLDNTENEDFQKILVQTINIEAKEPNQTYRRAFVDVSVYNN